MAEVIVSMPRPPAPRDLAPRAKDWTPIVDPDWTAIRSDADRRPCMAGPSRRRCGKPSVASIARGVHRVVWHYCRDHLYGRWIEAGIVMRWQAVA